jgi:4-amino-4-deoxy-L-arabinose transferase-like glycosyltransferase
MTFWIIVALVGVLAFCLGFLDLLRKFRRGDIRGRYLLAVIVAFIALAGWAVLSGLRPNAADSLVGLTMLAAALVAIVVIVREHQTLHYK